MKKMNKIFNLTFLAVFFSFIYANQTFAQEDNSEGLAAAKEENMLFTEEKTPILKDEPSIEKNITQPKEVIASPTKVIVEKSKTQKMVEKFTKSKVVQWLAKRTAIHTEKKAMRQELRQVKGDKTAQKAIKQKYEDRIKNVKALDSNIRIGLILVLVGIILQLLIDGWLGALVIVVGLVFIILGLI